MVWVAALARQTPLKQAREEMRLLEKQDVI